MRSTECHSSLETVFIEVVRDAYLFLCILLILYYTLELLSPSRAHTVNAE